MSNAILSSMLSTVYAKNFFHEIKPIKNSEPKAVGLVETAYSTAVDFFTHIKVGVNPYTGFAYSTPYWKTGGYISDAEQALDHERFCKEIKIRDLVFEIGSLEIDLAAHSGKKAAKLTSSIYSLKVKLFTEISKFKALTEKMTRLSGFKSWYDPLFQMEPEAKSASDIAQDFVSHIAVIGHNPEALTEFLNEIMAAIAEKVPGGEQNHELQEALRRMASCDATTQYEEPVVVEPSIVEVDVHDGAGPVPLSEIVNRQVEENKTSAMAEKLTRAAKLVQEGKRKNRNRGRQHHQAA